MMRCSSLTLGSLLLAALVHTSSAAISVSGLSDRARYNGQVTFTVAAPGGYDTAALLDGEPFPVGSPQTVTDVRYHELVVSQQPSGGGAVENQTYQFIVRNPERISTEDGLPTFTPPPVVDDAPSAFANGTFSVVAPARIPVGMSVPLVGLLRGPDGLPMRLNGPVNSTNYPAAGLRILRGFGSILLPAADQPATLNFDARLAGLSAEAPLSYEDVTWSPRGGALGGSETWGPEDHIYITNSLTIPSGATLRIDGGTVVALAAGVEVVVNGGVLEMTGTLADPVVFAPMSAAQPWGGIRLTTATGSRMIASGAVFTGSGAEADWFNTHGGYTVHRREQACVLVDVGAQAHLTNCFFVRLAGQAFHLKSGILSVTDGLVHQATTAGQLNGGTFTATRTGFIEFPDTTSNFVDEDNDAIYLIPGGGNTYTVEDCVFGFTKDDGIDTGAGHIVVRGSWFENCFHEGLSPSTTVHNMEIYDSVMMHCGQGVEQGFGNATVLVEHSALIGNMVGLRSGDNYGAPTFTDYSGHLTATDCVSVFNTFQDVWGYEWNSWTYRLDRMTIQDNYFTGPNGRHAGNLVWDPAADGGNLSDFMPVADSAVGLAITGTRSGSFFDYPGVFDVRLSTFSSRPVRVHYALLGKETPLSIDETTLAGGMLEFSAGETAKTLDLSGAGLGAFGFVRLALTQPQNAEVTSPELLYFNTPPPDPDMVLIPRSSSGWSYQALRAEPSGAWEDLGYVESNWNQNRTTPIGFGTIGVSGSTATLNTVLTSAEQGPSNDRTRAVYFRRHFNVPDASLVDSLHLTLMRDDAVVVYLNGVEVGRNNIDSGTTPGGVITYSRLATTTIDNEAESAYFDMPVPEALVDLLQTGENVIAAEVHQVSLTSSDLVLDLELVASFHPPVQNVTGIGRESDGTPYLYWVDPRWSLQTSSNLGDWLLVPGAVSPLRLDATEPSKFYRWMR